MSDFHKYYSSEIDSRLLEDPEWQLALEAADASEEVQITQEPNFNSTDLTANHNHQSNPNNNDNINRDNNSDIFDIHDAYRRRVERRESPSSRAGPATNFHHQDYAGSDDDQDNDISYIRSGSNNHQSLPRRQMNQQVVLSDDEDEIQVDHDSDIEIVSYDQNEDEKLARMLQEEEDAMGVLEMNFIPSTRNNAIDDDDDIYDNYHHHIEEMDQRLHHGASSGIVGASARTTAMNQLRAKPKSPQRSASGVNRRHAQSSHTGQSQDSPNASPFSSDSLFRNNNNNNNNSGFQAATSGITSTNNNSNNNTTTTNNNSTDSRSLPRITPISRRPPAHESGFNLNTHNNLRQHNNPNQNSLRHSTPSKSPQTSPAPTNTTNNIRSSIFSLGSRMNHQNQQFHSPNTTLDSANNSSFARHSTFSPDPNLARTHSSPVGSGTSRNYPPRNRSGDVNEASQDGPTEEDSLRSAIPTTISRYNSVHSTSNRHNNHNTHRTHHTRTSHASRTTGESPYSVHSSHHRHGIHHDLEQDWDVYDHSASRFNQIYQTLHGRPPPPSALRHGSTSEDDEAEEDSFDEAQEEQETRHRRNFRNMNRHMNRPTGGSTTVVDGDDEAFARALQEEEFLRDAPDHGSSRHRRRHSRNSFGSRHRNRGFLRGEEERFGIDMNDYESLSRLSELVPPVRKGLSNAITNSLPHVQGSNDECTICLGDNQSVMIALPCAHKFHKECIIPHFKGSRLCPNCRYELGE